MAVAALFCAPLYSESSAARSSVVPIDLQVESIVDPVGVGSLHPSFGWKLKAVERKQHNLAQTAYEIRVSSSAHELAQDKADVWDSGRIASPVYYQATFAGTALQSQKTYFWKVRVWDQDNRMSAWSAPQQWTTALLSPSEWAAHWIAAAPYAPPGKPLPEEHDRTASQIAPMPIFRKDFEVTSKVEQAIVCVSGLGQYELRVNGSNVTSSVMNPGWTDYRKAVLYNSYDVTRLLKPGSNVFAVLLGGGMYDIPSVKDRYSKFTSSFGQPKLILQMKVLYTDGSQLTIKSDKSWQTSPGPIVFSSIYGGEDFDADKEPAGWDKPGFNATGWASATEVASPVDRAATAGNSLFAQAAPPMEIAQTLRPVKSSRPSATKRVYDLGQNISGWPFIEVRGHAGDTVRLIAGELLDSVGNVTQRSANAGPNDPVIFSYRLRGNGMERWHPRFSYYGFRYVRAELRPALSGGAAPALVLLRGEFVHDKVRVDGRFASSVTLLNSIHHLIDQAVLSNLASVITDCPTREKLGWLEQTHLNAATLMYNYDVRGLYAKTADDMQQAQLADGLVPSIAPEFVAFVDEHGGSTSFRDSPEWGSAVILSSWNAYQFYGDRELLARHYDSMRRYALYLRSRLNDHVLDYGLGDWYDIGPGAPGESQLTSKVVTATATYYQDLTALREIATLLGKSNDATEYAQQAAELKMAFNQRVFHPTTHQYDRGSQTANAMPLAVGLVPNAERAAVLDNLVADIRSHNNHVTAGDVGFHYVVRALTDGGRSDVLYDMLSRTDSPSYGYQLSRGATTLTEAWDTNPASSQNHFMLGHAEEWFYRGLAGIDVDLSREGPRQIMIRPAMIVPVREVSASYESVLGKIVSSWKHVGNATVLEVSIPPGARATVELPSNAQLMGTQLKASQPLKRTKGQVKDFELGSGSYRFRSVPPS